MPPKKTTKKGGSANLQVSSITNASGLTNSAHNPYNIANDPIFTIGKYIPAPFGSGNVADANNIMSTNSMNSMLPNIVGGGKKKTLKKKTTKKPKKK